MNNRINLEYRVWLEDFNGPSFVKSIDSNKANC